jgi:dihydroflavonol-4-reductase
MFIIAGPKVITVKELVDTIAQVTGVRPPAIHLPIVLGKTGGHILELAFLPLGKQPPFSRRSVDFFLKDNAYDIGKAEGELGFQPKVDLHSGLSETLDWLRSRKNSPLKDVNAGVVAHG